MKFHISNDTAVSSTKLRTRKHDLCLFYSYNTLTRDMRKIYVWCPCVYFCHIPSNRVITVIFYTPVDEMIIDSKV